MDMKQKSMMPIVKLMKEHAETGYCANPHDLRNPYYFDAMRFHKPTGTALTFVRYQVPTSEYPDTSYKRWYELQISFWDSKTEQQQPFEQKRAKTWVHLFFPNLTEYVWETGEPTEGIHHFYVFCDESWQPIKLIGQNRPHDTDVLRWKSWGDTQ